MFDKFDVHTCAETLVHDHNVKCPLERLAVHEVRRLGWVNWREVRIERK